MEAVAKGLAEDGSIGRASGGDCEVVEACTANAAAALGAGGGPIDENARLPVIVLVLGLPSPTRLLYVPEALTRRGPMLAVGGRVAVARELAPRKGIRSGPPMVGARPGTTPRAPVVDEEAVDAGGAAAAAATPPREARMRGIESFSSAEVRFDRDAFVDEWRELRRLGSEKSSEVLGRVGASRIDGRKAEEVDPLVGLSKG